MNAPIGADADARWRRLVFPDDYTNPEPQSRYHLCVIGAGPAGLVTSIAAAGLGARVALIEHQAMGGDCLNVGCIPSKALLEFTRRNGGAEYFASAYSWLKTVRADIAEHDSVTRYTQAGVDVFLGSAAFRDSRCVVVGGTDIRARRFVVATGARAVLPPIPGLADADPLTNESIFRLRMRPDRLAVIGAGPIGCELALVFARLGVRVDLFDVAAGVLPNEHPDAGRLVGQALEKAGVGLRLSAQINSVTRNRDGQVTLDTADGAHDADELLVAAGRRANTDTLQLEAAGIELTEHGLIRVDDRLRTSNRRIFAAGDVCSALQFTHHADAHARIVVRNALFFPSGSTRRLVVPHCTYTQPEVAQVGSRAAELSAQGQAFDTYRIAFGDLDRGRAEGDKDGFAEVLTRKGSDEILGATVVGHDAGEQIASICVAMKTGTGLGTFASVVLPYPTRAEFVRRLADQYNRTRLTPAVSRIMRQWFRWTA